jgi:hypothetical protein
MADPAKPGTGGAPANKNEDVSPRKAASATTEPGPASSANLTEIGICDQLEGQFLAQGKTPEEAKALAKARAKAMCGG